MLAADVGARASPSALHGGAGAHRDRSSSGTSSCSSAVYGTGSAFFAPAFDAFVPDLLAGERLAQANALDQLVRPLALRLAGPGARRRRSSARRGAGRGVRARRRARSRVSARRAAAHAPRRARRRRRPARPCSRDLRAGLALRARAHTWLWATFASAAIAYLLFMGPVEVLLPLRRQARRSAAARPTSGIVFAAGGLGSVGCAVALGRRGLPRRDITFMYVVWTLATLAVAGYGLASAVWQLMLASLAFNALETAGHDRLGDGQAAPRARRTCSAASRASTG